MAAYFLYIIIIEYFVDEHKGSPGNAWGRLEPSQWGHELEAQGKRAPPEPQDSTVKSWEGQKQPDKEMARDCVTEHAGHLGSLEAQGVSLGVSLGV